MVIIIWWKPCCDIKTTNDVSPSPLLCQFVLALERAGTRQILIALGFLGPIPAGRRARSLQK